MSVLEISIKAIETSQLEDPVVLFLFQLAAPVPRTGQASITADIAHDGSEMSGAVLHKHNDNACMWPGIIWEDVGVRGSAKRNKSACAGHNNVGLLLNQLTCNYCLDQRTNAACNIVSYKTHIGYMLTCNCLHRRSCQSHCHQRHVCRSPPGCSCGTARHRLQPSAHGRVNKSVY